MPWLPLLSALYRLAEGQAELVDHTERGWTSVTFSGTRHTVVLAFCGLEAMAVGEQFIAVLAEHEFTIPRHLVADATVTKVEHTIVPEPRLVVSAELLLLEDA